MDSEEAVTCAGGEQRHHRTGTGTSDPEEDTAEAAGPVS